jgi:thioredoxin 1
MTTIVRSETFSSEVLHSEQPVLVDFWAPWCGPCIAVAPAVDELASDYEGRARVVKVNVDEAQDIAAEFNISSIPCFLVFKAGKVQSRTVGAVQKAQLASLLDAQLARSA